MVSGAGHPHPDQSVRVAGASRDGGAQRHGHPRRSPSPDVSAPVLEADVRTTPPPQPDPLQLSAPSAPQAALALALTVSPDPLTVGTTATLVLTLTNPTDLPLTAVAVTLPIPAEVSAADAPDSSWRWHLPTLAAQASTVLTTSFQLSRMPQGQALLLTPQATARELAQPVAITSGAPVQAAADTAATTTFVPGAPTTLQSADRQVTVQLPPGLATQRLAIRHAPQPARPALARAPVAPVASPGFRRGLGAFELTASDDQGTRVHQFAQPLTIQVRYTDAQLAARQIDAHHLVLAWLDETTQTWVPLPTTVDPGAQTATATVDHFTRFQLMDGTSPSTAFLPTLKPWQVSLF